MVTTGGAVAGRRSGLDRLAFAFDDERAVANAGLLVGEHAGRPARDRAGWSRRRVDLGERPGAARPGRKLLTLVHATLVGGDSIDDCRCAALRRDRQRVLGASGAGALDAGDVPALVHLRACAPARPVLRADLRPGLGGGRGAGRAAADDRPRLDDRRGRTGTAKQGAGFGYTKRRGYHPLLATRAEQRRGAARAAAQGIGAEPARRASASSAS